MLDTTTRQHQNRGGWHPTSSPPHLTQPRTHGKVHVPPAPPYGRSATYQWSTAEAISETLRPWGSLSPISTALGSLRLPTAR
ncbi:hypothetical protein CSPX01_14454 [Colletotrichum filicis]|nr:hypothetical protein CSPX01_14454 [Colletotrichum filicis]